MRLIYCSQNMQSCLWRRNDHLVLYREILRRVSYTLIQRQVFKIRGLGRLCSCIKRRFCLPDPSFSFNTINRFILKITVKCFPIMKWFLKFFEKKSCDCTRQNRESSEGCSKLIVGKKLRQVWEKDWWLNKFIIHLWRHSVVLALHYFHGMACYQSAILLEVMESWSLWNLFFSRDTDKWSCYLKYIQLFMFLNE